MKKHFLGIVLLLISSLFSTAHAQEDTPTPTLTLTPVPDTTLIYQQTATVYFPVALEFRASIAARAENLKEGTLTLFQTSGYQESIKLSFEGENNSLLDTRIDTTELRETVSFEDGKLPRPFEPLAYRWNVTTKDGRVGELAEEIVFQPQGLTWQQIDQPPLTFWWYNEGLGMNTMRESLLNVYNLLTSQTDEAPELNFVIFEADFRYCDAITDPESDLQREVMPGNANLPCSLDVLRQFLSDHDLIFFQRQNNDFETLQNQLILELVSRFYAPLWGKNKAVPAWYINGLAQLYRQSGDIRALVLVQAALAQEGLLPLDDLSSEPSEDQRELWGAQSYLLVLYLADSHGAEAPFELARSLENAEDFESALESLTGTSQEQLYRGWRTWLQTRGAEVAVLWNPYLETTPSPTPTASDTPIPPTDTPTNTPTITLTPTSTSLIGRIPTDIPIITPSAAPPTFIPTATNTPLPPGSFPTSTPRPVSDDKGGNGLPCAAPAALAPVVGIVLAWKRKKKP